MLEEPQEPPIDPTVMAELLESTGGDREFLAELIQTYLEDAARQIAQLRTAASSGLAEDLARPAHALKGASASVGATGMAELARAMETAARSGEVVDAPAAIDALEAELGRVTAALATEG
jgi:histidine phosphotransfer protein HptB